MILPGVVLRLHEVFVGGEILWRNKDTVGSVREGTNVEPIVSRSGRGDACGRNVVRSVIAEGAVFVSIFLGYAIAHGSLLSTNDLRP